MTLTVRDAARLLGIGESSVFRLVDQQGLPASKVGEQYRFNRAELLEWALANKVKVSPSLFPEEGAAPPSGLSDCLSAGGIFKRIIGTDKQSVLREVVRVMPLPPEVDRDFLLEVLLARESLGSTGLGNGIAIPHARTPIVMHIPRPMVSLCFLDRPVEFDAVDGRPVHTLFPIVSPTIKSHLSLLSRISFALRDPDFAAVLHARGAPEEILAAAARIDERIASSAG